MSSSPEATPDPSPSPRTTSLIPRSRSSGSVSLTPAPASDTPSPTSSRRKPKRELVVIPPQSGPSTAAAPSPALSTASLAPDGSKKLTKWLTRNRAKSVGADEVLNPTICVSPSSSTQLNLSQGASSPRPSSSSSTGERERHGVGFGSLSLRSSRRGSRVAGDEVLEEWATADLEEGEGEGEENRRKGSDKSSSKGGRFSLKRTKSNLKLFGRDSTPPPAPSASPPISTGSTSSSRAPYGTANPSASLLDLRSSTSSFQTPPALPLTRSVSNTLAQSQNGANPNVAGRIGGWFTSMLHNGASGSSSHLPLPTMTESGNGSPTTNGGSVKLASPKKNGGGSPGGRLGPLDRMLDKALQYFLDTDSTADRCEDDIWVLGVRHPGYVAGAKSLETAEEMAEREREREEKHRKRKSLTALGKSRKGKEKKRGDSTDLAPDRSSLPRHSSSPPLPSPPTFDSPSSPPTTSSSPRPSIQLSPPSASNGWPILFFHDFYSRIALTYRSGFPPIPCSPQSGGVHSVLNTLSMSMGRGGSRANEGLSSDTGWGCMLRTGQSLLANALVTVHLGRNWRRPLPVLPSPINSRPASALSFASLPPPPQSPSHAEYARLLSLFIDDPSPLAPFSVHRFALMGKQLGKEVGEWFGPSTAAGAIKALVTEFKPAGLAVCSVVDGTVYRSDVEAAAEGAVGKRWKKPVLVLIGLRLGIDGVNPIYYEAIKTIFQFPQSVGIAGGRPSSSYYFVGAQADSLFYIDPHHPRPSIPLRHPPADLFAAAQSLPLSSVLTPSTNVPDLAISDSFITVVSSPTTPSPAQTSNSADRLGDFFVEAYPDSALRTYHCDKVRKMALSSLDPSMLLGFLIQDEDDWEDFSSRVRQLAQNHKPIFALADSPPAWMRRSAGSGGPASSTTDSDAGDSFSEPDDWELDSTDASASGLASTPPLRVAEDEEWEDERGQAVREPEPVVESVEALWHTAAGPLSSRPSQDPVAMTPEDESLVVVSPSSSVPVGGEGVLVNGAAVEFEKKDEGWEGVGIKEGDESASNASDEGEQPVMLRARTSSLPVQVALEGAVAG